jgi:hypothetical protein
VSFDPGIDSMRAAGIPVTRQPYADGSAGIRQSLDTMALKMREGRIDAAVIGWAGQVLKAAGLDGRDRNTTPAKQAAALLDALRESTVYAPDAYGTEVIQSAAATLCLRPGLCLNRGDCDDLSVALGSATLSLGLPTQIVKQNFGGDAQEHVLIVVWDGNAWQYADPSTKMPFGSALKAVSEVWVDPMEPIGNLPEAKAEIVTLGRPGRALQPRAPAHHWLGMGAVVTPGDILAYRQIWDSYVMDTARAAAACSAAWQAQANGTAPATPPNVGEFATPPDKTTLQLWATWQKNISDDIVLSWNRFSGLQDWEIVTSGANILQGFQDTVQRVGQFYQPQIQHDCPMLVLPVPPSIDLQKQVIGQIEGLGILAHGVLQLFEMGASGALQTYETIGEKITNPSTLMLGGIGIALGVVGTIAGLYALNSLLPARR